jgi:anti-sigma factor RsiW
MIDCPNGDIRDLLPDYLHGHLDAAERTRVEAHVATCEMCQDELALLRDLRATMGRAPALDVGIIAAAIPPYRAPVRHNNWASWRAAAAIATIAIGGTSVALLNRQPTSAPRSTVAVNVAPARSTPSSSSQPVQTPREAVEPAVATPTPRAPEQPAAPSTEPPARELAMAGGTVSDLSDRELTALLDDIESLDALPSADVETALPVTPLAPAGGTR